MRSLDSIPRLRLAHLPTPLERLDRLAHRIAGPAIWAKRDDATGLGLGGNKVRKLEFLLAEALAQGATTVVTVGGVQSNHARQTAAAAARLGLHCELVLPRVGMHGGELHERNGNVLLDQLFGARVHIVADAVAAGSAMGEIRARVAREGGTLAFVPAGGSTPTGSLGYVAAALEFADQARAAGFKPTAIVLAASTGGTLAGLVVGLRAAGLEVPVLGIMVYEPAAQVGPVIARLIDQTAERLGLDREGWEGRYELLDGYLGPGYGAPTPGMIAALRLVAESEGLLLDPVYTGKAMAGLLDLIERRRFGSGDSVVFWHTGGAPGLFAYADALAGGADS